MTTPESPQQAAQVRQEIMRSVGGPAFREFSIAFTLMSLIPLLIGSYVYAARLLAIDIFRSWTRVYLLLAVVFALLGFVVGRRLVQTVLARLVEANIKVRQHELLKSGFVANVAYELRPPLAAVQLSLKNLTDGLLGSLSDAQRQLVADCHVTVDRLTRLTTDLIELTDVEQGREGLQLDAFELRDAVHEAVHRGRAYFTSHELTAELQLPKDPVWFFGDRQKLMQALTCLLYHASRSSPVGAAVTIELQPLPQEWRLTVAHPLPPDQRSAGGAPVSLQGLGLHLVKDIAERHHGRYWSDTNAQGMARSILALPVVETPSQPPSSRSAG